MKILLVASASVSLPIAWKISRSLAGLGHEIEFFVTRNAFQMLMVSHNSPEKRICRKVEEMDEFPFKAGNVVFENEMHEYESGGSVWHVDKAKECDAMLVAPASMDLIGKVVHGISGEPVLDLISVFLGTGKPAFFAPAMNTNMWRNPFVQSNMAALERVLRPAGGIIRPDTKKLACGDYGVGALADARTICDLIAGKRWLCPFPGFMKNHESFAEYIPRWDEPGAFAALRKFDVHQGVDIYQPEGTVVHAVEDGVVVGKGQFTGAGVNCGWWNDTDYVAVEGDSGIVVYGEIKVSGGLDIESKVKAGDVVGMVMTVCKEDPKQPVRNHLNSMLHLELYRGIEHSIDIEWGRNGGGYGERPIGLMDPTPYLMFSTP
ncbi:MAG: hypothetical protein J6Y62_05830 [Clostridia bacterium]|nr:hypothetical protein [Clostridia bacterium]